MTAEHTDEATAKDEQQGENQEAVPDTVEAAPAGGDPAQAGTGDEVAAEAAAGNEIEQLRQEVENLRQKADESLEKTLRAQAEMENLRKRTSRDIENAHKFALEKFIKELLPVIDSMELGISASSNGSGGDIESLREGMDLTLKKFIDTLEKFGVEIINPVEEKFDPQKHEAVSVQQVEGAESGMVTAVMQKGYELNGRLVRPAMVIVTQ